jgi:CubicO group peptidase (beta-lactamase class C family)
MSSTLPDLHVECAGHLQDHLGRTCTAAVLRVEHHGQAALEIAMGVPDPEDAGGVTTPDTPFDLASITKVFTSTATLRLASAGEIALDTRVQSVLPNFKGTDKEEVQIRHLLTHTAGFPSLIRLWGPHAEASEPREAVQRLALVRKPGAEVQYSDPGFMLLGLIVECVMGESLDKALDHLVIHPLGLNDVSYGPKPEAAATEFDESRGRRIRGEVHDENAAVLGGVSGHAGLFGSARSVASLARAYRDAESNFLAPAIVREAVGEVARSGDERRGLGWKLRSPAEDASERWFGANTFGHYGFTGTAVWSDSEREIVVVLLTNRVYYGREREGIRALRQEIFKAVAARL